MVAVRRLILASAMTGLVLWTHAALAQGNCTFTDENGKTVTWPDCKPPVDGPAAPSNANSTKGAAVPSAGAKNFPYPGEKAATPNAPGANGPDVPNAPGTSGQSSAGTGTSAATAPAGSSAPAANRFPYPGEHTADHAPATQPGASDGAQSSSSSSQPPLNDAGSSGSSSSSADDGTDPSAGPLGDDDPAARAAEARRAHRKKGIDFHQTQDQREVEDLKVASFYQNDGNYRGAYERALDAVSIADDDAEAHLALANAARHMGKLDEAEKNYKKCLALDPVPKTANAAKKALKEMSGGGLQ